jgi:putative acetyltransferase
MTACISLRHSEPADIEPIRALYAEPGNYSNTLQLPWPSLALWQRRLGGDTPGFHSLVACRDGAIVGQIGIEQFSNPRRRHVANIGMGVAQQARRSGVGSALLEAAIELCEGWLGVTRIELEVYVDNAAALALYRKFAFELEGTARGYALRAGQFADVHLMARRLGRSS